jgi:hypothetical protein
LEHTVEPEFHVHNWILASLELFWIFLKPLHILSCFWCTKSQRLVIWTKNVISDANWIKISTDYFWNYHLILFDLLCRFLMYLLEFGQWVKILILNWVLIWTGLLLIYLMSLYLLFCLLCTDLKFGPGV